MDSAREASCQNAQRSKAMKSPAFLNWGCLNSIRRVRATATSCLQSSEYSHTGEYVVVGRQGALCGNVRLIHGKNYLSEHAIAVRANEENETKFLLYLKNRSFRRLILCTVRSKIMLKRCRFQLIPCSLICSVMHVSTKNFWFARAV